MQAANNYRSTFNVYKLMKSLIKADITGHLDSLQIVSATQHGFVKKIMPYQLADNHGVGLTFGGRRQVGEPLLSGYQYIVTHILPV